MAINDRRNAILDEVLAFNRDRKPKRVRLKLQRMDEGPFPFFRGMDHLFAHAWPELKPPDVGPTTLLCGDLHLENFGAYRSDDGDYLFDINDFDEALVAPVGLDLVRCTASTCWRPSSGGSRRCRRPGWPWRSSIITVRP
jgi:uncharacterized protein (DUF2252 family)